MPSTTPFPVILNALALITFPEGEVSVPTQLTGQERGQKNGEGRGVTGSSVETAPVRRVGGLTREARL